MNLVKTFIIPSQLVEVKENINIVSKFIPKVSKEEIIKEALMLHSQGKFSEAATCYQDCINQGFKDFRIFVNYGSILKGLGNLQAAEESTRKAIELNPEFPDSYFNLGNILFDQGKKNEAELFYKKAVKLNPVNGNAYFNLGLLMRSNSQIEKALYYFEKAKKANMDPNKCLAVIGKLYLDQGNHYEGIKNIREGEGSIIFDINDGFSII